MQEHVLPFQTILAFWHKGKFLVLTARALKSSRSKLYIFQYNLPSLMLPAVTHTLTRAQSTPENDYYCVFQGLSAHVSSRPGQEVLQIPRKPC